MRWVHDVYDGAKGNEKGRSGGIGGLNLWIKREKNWREGEEKREERGWILYNRMVSRLRWRCFDKYGSKIVKIELESTL